MPVNKPLALDAYERLAEAYAARIDTKPHNAYYERPATLSLLPDVAGLNVLDAGCGPGVYSEWLVQHGAQVVAVDASAKMLGYAKARIGSGVQFHQADLEGDVAFLQDGYFDVVLAPLVMDYLADWGSVFQQFHRVLKPAGFLVFSTGHPFFEATYFKTDKYFETEQVSCVWRGFGIDVDMPSYRRSLSDALNSVLESGFELVRVLEPRPTEEFKKADPVRFERLSRQPSFLCIKARKRAA
jgi:SAM-dependent methyltransferase